jgi:hypothetical protein
VSWRSLIKKILKNGDNHEALTCIKELQSGLLEALDESSPGSSQ